MLVGGAVCKADMKQPDIVNDGSAYCGDKKKDARHEEQEHSDPVSAMSVHAICLL